MLSNKSKRIPSLDGIRGISILMVLIGHACGLGYYINIGNLGVRIFFMISAYLIVGILYRDVLNQSFSLKRFYFKRLMRTFPAFYVYLLILVFVLLITNLFEFDQFWRAPIYLENYHPRSLWNSKQWFIGHSWSLAVEEQFYLLVAFLFYFLDKKIISQRTILYIFISLIVIAPLCRVSYLFFKFIPEVLKGSVHRSFETVVDSIAIGGLLALIPFQKILKIKKITYFKNKTLLLFLIVLFIQVLNSTFMRELFGLKLRYIYNLFGLSIMNLLLCIIIFNSMLFSKDTLLNKVLNSKILIYIGMLSYSIYLWQQIWLYKWNIPLSVKFVGIGLTSFLSYYLVELNFMKIRNKILLNNKI